VSSQERLVRPFAGVRTLNDLFVNTRLLVGNDLLEPDTSKVLLPHEFLNCRVSLHLAPTPKDFASFKDELVTGLEALELSANWVELAILLSTPRLKMVETYRYPLDDLRAVSRQLDLVTSEHRPAPLRSPIGGCSVDVYVVLSKTIDPVPLRPWRLGTWLARCRFHLTANTGVFDFAPIPLTDEDRSQLGLPQDVIRFVKLEGSPVLAGISDDVVQLYVDQDLLAQLTAAPNSPAARSFQRQLFLDAIRAVVTAAIRQSDFDGMTMGDLEGSIVGRLVTRLAGRRPGEPEGVLEGRRDLYLTLLRDEPERFLAEVEARINPKSDLVLSISGGDV
jgi:hypothetical protein